jgi:hypothetical protein
MVTCTISCIQYCTSSLDVLLIHFTNFVISIHVVLEGSVIRSAQQTMQLCRLYSFLIPKHLLLRENGLSWLAVSFGSLNSSLNFVWVLVMKQVFVVVWQLVCDLQRQRPSVTCST